MKKRFGFVSNSSSSSFIAWGVSTSEMSVSDEKYLELFTEHFSWLATNKDRSRRQQEKYAEMSLCENEEEMIEYAKENLSPSFEEGEISQCRHEGSEYVGIELDTLIRQFPDLKLSEIPAFAAERLNSKFNTNFTEKNIQYIEEAWYDG